VWIGTAESEASTVNVNVPVSIGLPLISPVGVRLRPVGRAAEDGSRVQVYGGVPPVAERTAVYWLLTKPPPSVSWVRAAREVATWRVSVLVENWAGGPASATWKVSWVTPTVVGVPEIVPVLGSRFRPGGIEPAVSA